MGTFFVIQCLFFRQQFFFFSQQRFHVHLDGFMGLVDFQCGQSRGVGGHCCALIRIGILWIQLVFESFLLFQQGSVFGLPFLLSCLPIPRGKSLLPGIDDAHSRPRRNDSSQPIPVRAQRCPQFFCLFLKLPPEMFFQYEIDFLGFCIRCFLECLEFLPRFGEGLLEGCVENRLVSSHGLELLVLVLQLLLQFDTFGLPFFSRSLGGEEGSRRGRCCCGGSHSSRRRGCV
mmetsp:Transcript_4204/g.8731  ORF Transcript_4204/g.8731 Transcript_4204/m.8731 type:complete len:230 (-) Transcript_4204:497-1186(-)